MIPAEDTNLQHKQKSIPTSDCVDVVPQVFVYSVPISLQTDKRCARVSPLRFITFYDI